MTYYCKKCDKIMNSLSKYKHFKSKTNSRFKNSTIGRHIILNPKYDEVDEIMWKYVKNYNKNMNYLCSMFIKFINNNKSC